MAIERPLDSGNGQVVDITSWAKETLDLPEMPGDLIFIKRWVDTKGRATGYLARWGIEDWGVSGGGIRMKTYDTEVDAALEAVKLAATMSQKFGIAGPKINGSKFVINYDPNSEDKLDVLREFVTSFQSDLESVGTAGDLNVSEQEAAMVMLPLGIENPQKGILRGLGILDKLPRLDQVVMIPLSEPFSPKHQVLVDVTAGKSTESAVVTFFEERGENLKDKTIAIQGVGSVGGSAGFYLEQHGAKIVYVADAQGSMQIEGSFADLLKNIDPKTGCLPRNEQTTVIGDPQEVLYQNVDILIVAATSKIITLDNVEKIKAANIFEGANVPILPEAEMRLTDKGINVFPDFVVNAGTAELFTVGMLSDCEITEEAVLDIIEAITKNATQRTVRAARDLGLSYRGAARFVATQNLWQDII